jgi:hypothetical protein
MARYFNTTGPCDPALHYALPAEDRLPELAPFFDRQQYFVLHAPRQTGKTTAMRAVAARLRSEGLAACWATLEGSQGVGEVAEAEALWLRALHRAGRRALPPTWAPPDPSDALAGTPGDRLGAYLCAWAEALSVPLVLLLDEADGVAGAALVSLLRQLREGFMDRGVGRFPTSVALIGMRDLRDYVALSKDGRSIHPGSPFNINAGSITLRNFNAAEVVALLGQHEAETGQPFLPEAAAEIAEITDGQPYLVNALADLCVSKGVPDRSQPIGRSHVEAAREQLIRARTTHLDNLAERLKEPRVAAIIQAILTGDSAHAINEDSEDSQYVRDLGLIRLGSQGLEAANPIYREVLARQLSHNIQSSLQGAAWPWAHPDGRLNMAALLAAFRPWWREHADVVASQTPNYPEALPHLALCAFLQRVVNGGGRVHREFAAGRGAMDLLVEFGPDRFALEIKRVRSRDSLETVIQRGGAQLARYLDTVGLGEGWLVVFDVRPGRTWEERLFSLELVVEGKTVRVLGA